MSLDFIIWLTSMAVCLSMLLQSTELLVLCFKGELLNIWSFENLKGDLKFKFLFSEASFKVILVIQILTAILGLFFPSFIVIAVLFLTHLLTCIRFRGTFNGGSDMMTFVILTGLLISQSSGNGDAQEIGLVYISIHALYSYFKAGFSKIIRSEWRSGIALPVFVESSLFPDSRQVLGKLFSKRVVAIVSAWFVILFELLVVLLLLWTDLSLPYFVMAILFHAIVFLVFGLNRFFWAWAGAWPSLFYCLNLISQYT